MGHRRLGLLPKSQKWRDIVGEISQAANGEVAPEKLIQRLAHELEQNFRQLHLDSGVEQSLSFLVAVGMAGRSSDFQAAMQEMGFSIASSNPTPIALAKALEASLRTSQGSREYTELARAAATRALASYFTANTLQGDLFPDPTVSSSVWHSASTGAGFCELSRSFFAELTTSYFRYFLDREASMQTHSIEARDGLQRSISEHIDVLAHHCFETSKIAQSFAAGWYNKHTSEGKPGRKSTRAFLRIASNKIYDSLIMEAV